MTRFKRNTLALAVGVCLGAASAYSYATGGAAPVVVKPPIVVVNPTTVTPPPAAPSAPAQQPSVASGSGHFNWFVMVGVAVYFTAVIRSHMIWCAEDDKKPANERKCYRPLRDGMPS